MALSTSEASNGTMIDVKSMADYRKEFERQRLQNRHATETEILLRVKEYIKRRIDAIVHEACNKCFMDFSTVTLSLMSGTVIPFSGMAVALAATVMQCLKFSVTLGLIPLLHVHSFSDVPSLSDALSAMMHPFQTTIDQASERDSLARVEMAVLDIQKKLGLDDWLWSDVLTDILVEIISEGAMDAAWFLSPLLFWPKYKMHRHHTEKMYRKLGTRRSPNLDGAELLADRSVNHDRFGRNTS